jgi:hypothetical protein
MGRAKFVAPLFKTLIGEDAWGKAIAEPLYARAKPGYHSVTSGRVDKLMSGEEE